MFLKKRIKNINPSKVPEQASIDIYFEKILPNFPTLRAQVEDLDVADKIVENIEKEEDEKV